MFRRFLLSYMTPLFSCISLYNSPKPHKFHSVPLESSFSSFKFLKSYFVNRIANIISNFLVNILKKKIINFWDRYPLIFYSISRVYNKGITFKHYVFKYVLMYLSKRYPFSLKIFLYLYSEYTKILTGNLEGKHVNLFISIGIVLKSSDFFKWLSIMILTKLFKDYILTKKDYIFENKIFIRYPFLYDVIISFFTAFYILSLYNCIDIIYEGLILPLVNKLISCFKNIKTIILKMRLFGWGSSNNLDQSPTSNPNSSPSPNPNPSPNSNSSIASNKDSHKSKGKRKEKEIEAYKKKHKFTEEESKQFDVGLELERVRKGCDNLADLGGNHNTNYELDMVYKEFIDKYFKWLPNDSKTKVDSIQEAYKKKGSIAHKGYDTAPNVKTYWEYVKNDSKVKYQTYTKIFQIFEENKQKIKKDNLGGADSSKSKLFNKEFNDLKIVFSTHYKAKDDVIKDQIKKSDTLDAMLKERNISVAHLFDKNILLK